MLIRCGNRGGPWQFAVARDGAGRLRVPESARRRGFDPESLPRGRDSRAGEREPGPAAVRRPEGPGVRQVPRRGQGGGHRRAGAVERRRQVPPRRADRLGACTRRPRSPRATSRRRSPWPTAASSPGIVRNETASAVEIQDADAKLIRIAKDEIDERKRSDVSLMPTGLAQGLSPEDFADLIAYLETLKNVDATGK